MEITGEEVDMTGEVDMTKVFAPIEHISEPNWEPTPYLRWFRLRGASDNERVLQQLWVCRECGVEWREVVTEFAD